MATIPTTKTWAVNDIPTAAEFNQYVRDAHNFFKAPPRVLVKSNVDLTRSSRTSWSLVTWNTPIAETDGTNGHVSGQPSRIVALTAGRYHVWCNIQWEDHTVQLSEGDRGIQIRKNSGGSDSGGASVGIDHRHAQTAANVPNTAPGCSQQGVEGFVSLAVNDYVEVFAYDADDDTTGIFPTVDSGCTLDLTRYNAARFGMVWIST